MDLYDKIFTESKKSKKLLYFKKYTGETSFCGYVLSFNSNTVQIQHFTRNGKSDGVITLRYSDINYITVDNDYLKSIQYIIDNNTLIDSEQSSTLPLDSSSNWVFNTLNEYKKDKSTLLGIEANGDWYVGFVNDVDDIFFSFTEIDRNGFVLDTSIYKLEDVSSIHINELESRRRLLLYNWHKSIN
ncbi:hypothetical protein [Dysgonomonas gadei]|uniref:hypothetical protein n=1 Tax=Dysgonomonas gadei TaxID=156974 RepID=UPI003AF153C3